MRTHLETNKNILKYKGLSFDKYDMREQCHIGIYKATLKCPVCGLIYENCILTKKNYYDHEYDFITTESKCELGHDLLDDTQETVCDKLQNTSILVRAL
jgi:hypothetical protein